MASFSSPSRSVGFQVGGGFFWPQAFAVFKLSESSLDLLANGPFVFA
jgi:hypothetical protein